MAAALDGCLMLVEARKSCPLALAPEERAQLSAAARRAVVERWSWAGVAKRLLEPFH